MEIMGEGEALNKLLHWTEVSISLLTREFLGKSAGFSTLGEFGSQGLAWNLRCSMPGSASVRNGGFRAYSLSTFFGQALRSPDEVQCGDFLRAPQHTARQDVVIVALLTAAIWSMR